MAAMLVAQPVHQPLSGAAVPANTRNPPNKDIWSVRDETNLEATTDSRQQQQTRRFSIGLVVSVPEFRDESNSLDLGSTREGMSSTRAALLKPNYQTTMRGSYIVGSPGHLLNNPSTPFNLEPKILDVHVESQA